MVWIMAGTNPRFGDQRWSSGIESPTSQILGLHSHRRDTWAVLHHAIYVAWLEVDVTE